MSRLRSSGDIVLRSASTLTVSKSVKAHFKAEAKETQWTMKAAAASAKVRSAKAKMK
jgi:hypothetical protein